MNTKTTQVQGSRLLTVVSQRADMSPARIAGPQLITSLLRLLRVAEMFTIPHAQTAQAAQALCLWLSNQHQHHQIDAFTLLFTDSNVFLNATPIRLDEQQHLRSVSLRTAILASGFNQLRLLDGLQPNELIELLTAMHDGPAALATFSQPHILLGISAERPSAEDTEHDPRREILSLYAAALIKTAAYFDQLKTEPAASARHVKRAIQRISDNFSAHRNIFIGLINMRLVPTQGFVHAVHTAIYAMFIAQELGLERTDVVRIGMTSITQDIHYINQPDKADSPPDSGDQRHFITNMSSVKLLSQLGISDVLSALRLVTGYERGFAHTKPLPNIWYQETRKPHLLTRIIEIAKHYDLFVQGLPHHPGLSPDLALQAIMIRSGTRYDPDLARIFINILGVYPVGSQVLLSTGERALVVRSPTVGDSHTAQANAHRPVVRLNATGRLLDLSLDEHRAVRIASLLEGDDALEDHPGAFAFF